VNFCKLFLKIFSVLTGKAGGFIDLKVYKKKAEPDEQVPLVFSTDVQPTIEETSTL
jgi:hypothetical protein